MVMQEFGLQMAAMVQGLPCKGYHERLQGPPLKNFLIDRKIPG